MSDHSEEDELLEEDSEVEEEEDWKAKYDAKCKEVDDLKKKVIKEQKKVNDLVFKAKKIKSDAIQSKKDAEDEYDKEVQIKQKEGNRNMLFGVGVAVVLSIICFAMIYDTLEAAYTGTGKTTAIVVFSMFILSSLYLLFAFLCEDLISSIGVCAAVCAMFIVAFLCLFQFQMYLGLLAWAYPYMVEPKALMNADFSYDPPFRELNLTAIAAEMEWTYEPKEVPWKTLVNTQLGYETDFILPNSESVGLVAHFIPIVAALIYQFGIGATDIIGLAGVVMDFVDVQDFYLLLLENDIVVSYWSRPKESNEWWGTEANFGKVNVTLANNETYEFNSTQRLFEDWQKEHMLSFCDNIGLNGLLGFQIDGPYYNYNMWKYIMYFFILASNYVTLWPMLELALHKLLGATDWDMRFRAGDTADVDSIWLKRTSLMAIQAALSLTLIEVPFLVLRFACSQYYGIVMSSLFIKNIVSIFIDTLKLFVYFFGCNISAEYLDWQEGNIEKDWSYYAKKYLLRVLTIGEFIGEDFAGDTKNTLPLCYSCCLEHPWEDDHDAFKPDRYDILEHRGYIDDDDEEIEELEGYKTQVMVQ